MNEDRGFNWDKLGAGIVLSGWFAFVVGFPAFTIWALWEHGQQGLRKQSCAYNLKSLGIGILSYAQDYDGAYPVSLPYRTASGIPADWDVLIEPYTKSTRYFQCPEDSPWNRSNLAGPGQEHYLSYGMPRNFAHATSRAPAKRIPHPERTILLAEVRGMRGDSGKQGKQGKQEEYLDNLGTALTWRHYQGANFLFLDGHTTSRDRSSKISGGHFPKFEGYTFSYAQGALCGENDPLPQ